MIGENEYVHLHPVSRWRFKCPPPAFFSELIQELDARGKKIVLTSGPDSEELKMIAEIVRPLSHIPLLNLAGKTTLKQLGAIVHLSETLICVDSVPLHLASALKTPVVALFGPSSDQNWGPWQHPQARVVAQAFSCRPCHRDGCGGSKMSDCLFTLSVSRVLEALENIQAPTFSLS
jgi:heptosyltransferase-3